MRRDCNLGPGFPAAAAVTRAGKFSVPFWRPSFMRCPSCGAVHSSRTCPNSATVAATALAFSPREVETETDEANALMDAPPELEEPARTERPVSRLTEFPGVTHRPVTQWRK